MSYLEYIFGNFWHFIGFVIVLGMLLKGLVVLVVVILNRDIEE